MRVVLLRPPYVIPLTSVFGNKGLPPLGIAYLAGALKAAGHQVTCIDAFAEDMDRFSEIDDTGFLVNGLDIEGIIKRIPKETQIIGISSMFSCDWINITKIIHALKVNFPQTIIVMGGEHATADSDYILTHFPQVEACIPGEGEVKLTEFVNQVERGVAIKDIPGVRYFDKNQNQCVTNPSDYRIKDINSIPLPAWDLLPIELYLNRGLGMAILGKRSMPMLLSRGCPYKCTFCTNEDMWTTRWIARDVELVIAEIKLYIDRYQMNHIDFYDLTAVINKNWMVNFCKRLIEENLNLTWSMPSGTRSEALDQEVLSLLYKSGCTKLTYAPETGSERVAKLIKKRVKLNNMLKSMRTAVKEGIIVKANMVFGFPDDTFQDVFKSFFFLFQMALIGVHDVPCFIFTPYPGSPLFRRLVSEGKIKKDENYELFLARMVYTSPLDRRSWSDHLPDFIMPYISLGGMGFFYFWQFIFRPWRFVGMMKRLIQKKPLTMLDAALSNVIDDFINGRRLK